MSCHGQTGLCFFRGGLFLFCRHPLALDIGHSQGLTARVIIAVFLRKPFFAFPHSGIVVIPNPSLELARNFPQLLCMEFICAWSS